MNGGLFIEIKITRLKLFFKTNVSIFRPELISRNFNIYFIIIYKKKTWFNIRLGRC